MDKDLITVEGTARADFLRGSWQDDLILAGAGNDLVFAGAGNDVVDAGDGNDAVFAGAGDDLVKTGLGSDFADGGRGIDTAQFDGDSADYRITSFFGFTFITDLRNGETDTLTRFEFLKFDDGVFDINGNPVATDPEAVDDEASTIEDAAITIDVLANDSDPNNDPLTVTEATAASGKVEINPDGTLSYTPAENFSGKDTISYTISDGNGGTSSATVSVMVGGVADVPDLQAPASFETLDLQEIMLADLVANLGDRDGSERLKIKFGNLPEGAVILNKAAVADSEARIAVLEDRIGRLQEETGALEGQLVELRALIDDLEQSDPTSDRLPVLREQRDAGEIRLEQALAQKLEIEANRDKLVLEKGELSKTAGPDGIVAFDDLGSGFALQLPPGTTEDFVLEVHAIATESDPVAGEDVRTAVSKASVEIVVGESPSLKDDEAETKEDEAVTVKVLDNDEDSDGDALKIAEVTDGNHGTVVNNGDGTVDYRPNRDFSGEDTFTYTVEDGNGGRSTATVNVLVGGVADRAQLLAPQGYEIRDQAELQLEGLVARLVDRDGSEKLTVEFSNLPVGAVILNPAAIADKDAAIADRDSLISSLSADIETLNSDIAEVSAQIEELEQNNPDSEDLVALLGRKADLQEQVVEKADANARARQERDQLVFEKSQLTKEADANGKIGFHDLESGFVLRLPEGTTENFGLRVKAVATESDPVLDEADRIENNGVVINLFLLESPEANDDTAVTAEDTPVTIKVLDNDSDSDGDPLSVIDVLGVSNGSTVINDDGTITFTPDPDFSGETEFTYTITDGNGGISGASVKVLVGGVADTPNLLLPNALETIDLAPIPLDSIDASLMDTDGSESLKVKFRGLPEGAVISNPEKIAQKTGEIEDLTAQIDELEQSIADLEESIAATAKAIATLENDPNPPASSGQVLAQLRSLQEKLQGTLAEDTDARERAQAQRNEASAELAELTKAADADGNVEIEDFGDGYVLQLPKGTVDDLLVKVDATSTESEPLAGPEFETATISRSFQVIVRESLTPQDDAATTIEDVPVTIFATANDVGEGLQIVDVGAAANGTVVIDDNGDLLYTPNADFNGIDTFDYRVGDIFGVSETASVQVTVGGVADTPDLSLPFGLSTTDLAPIALDDVKAALTDQDGSESLKVKFGGLPPGALISNPALVGGINGRIEVVEADIARLDASKRAKEQELLNADQRINEIRSNPEPSQELLDELAALEQRKEDLAGELQQLSDSRAESVALLDKLDDDLAKVSQSAGDDGHVEFEDFGNGYFLQLPDGAVDDFKLTVEATATESDPLASPDTRIATASGEVQVSVQESPVAIDDAAVSIEDTAVTVLATANDTDSDGDSLTIVDVTNGANGTAVDAGSGNIRYTPNADFSGDDQFTYTVEDPDGNTSTATVRVTVNGVADVPGLTVPEGLQTIDLADTDLSGITGTLADTDGSETLLIRLSALPQGSVVINPEAIAALELERGQNDATIKILREDVRKNEGLISDKQVELVDLLDDPTSTPEQIAAKRQEITGLQEQIAADNKTVADATARNAEIAAEISTLTVTPDIDGVVGIPGETAGWVLQLPAGATEDFVLGVEALAFESDPVASEGDRTAISERPIVGISILESSQARNDSVGTNEDTPLTIPVLVNDLGDIGAPVDVVDVTNGANGTVAINDDGTLTYTPNADFNGNDQFTYTIEEEGTGQSTAAVNVTVAPVNDDPLGSPVVSGPPEVDQTLTANTDGISDADGLGPFTYQWEVLTGDDPDSLLSWDPIAGATAQSFTPGSDLAGQTLRVRVFYTDDGNTFETLVSQPIELVAPANQDPVAVDDEESMTLGLGLIIDVLANDTDPENDPLTILSVTDPGNGTAALGALPGGGQAVTYNPDVGFVGIDTFDYTITDGNGGTATATVTVNVLQGQVVPPPDDGGGPIDPPIFIEPPDDGGGGGVKPPPGGGGGGGGGVIIVPTPILPNPIQGSFTASQDPAGGTMTGTSDSDVFLFSRGDGAVDLLGFQQATGTAGEVADQIQFDGFDLAFADLDSNGDGQVGAGDAGVSGGGSDPLALDLGGGDVLSVNGVSFLTEDDLLFV